MRALHLRLVSSALGGRIDLTTAGSDERVVSHSAANPCLECDPSQESATLKTCNCSDTTQQDGTTHLDLLVFDAH